MKINYSYSQRKSGKLVQALEEPATAYAKPALGVNRVIPGVDDLSLFVCVEDDVTVPTVELTIALGFHRNSATALHPPDLMHENEKRFFNANM